MTLPDYIVSAVSFGLGDSFNPYMLSMVLGSVIFLAFIGNTLKRISLAGRFVIVAAFCGTFVQVWGTNGLWLEHPAAVRSIRFFSLGVAVVLLAVGYLLFQQWRHGKMNTSAQPLPAFLREETASGQNAGVIFFSVLLGLLTVLVATLWPRNQYIYFINYSLFAGGNGLLAVFFFALYSASFVFFLSLACWLVFRIKGSAKLRNDFLRAISWVRISCSAVVVAVGMGLIYLFITT